MSWPMKMGLKGRAGQWDLVSLDLGVEEMWKCGFGDIVESALTKIILSNSKKTQV